MSVYVISLFKEMVPEDGLTGLAIQPSRVGRFTFDNTAIKQAQKNRHDVGLCYLLVKGDGTGGRT